MTSLSFNVEKNTSIYVVLVNMVYALSFVLSWSDFFFLFFWHADVIRWQYGMLWILHLMKKCLQILQFFWWVKRCCRNTNRNYFIPVYAHFLLCFFFFFTIFLSYKLFFFDFVPQVGEYQGAYKVRHANPDNPSIFFCLQMPFRLFFSLKLVCHLHSG